MSDIIFVTEKTESSTKILENNNKFARTEQHTQGARKNGGKTRVPIWRENRNKGIQFIEKF